MGRAVTTAIALVHRDAVGAVALLRPPGHTAHFGGQARSRRAAAATAQRQDRFLGNVGEPSSAERTARRPDGAESDPADRSSARELREHRAELQGRPAVHAVGGRAAQAADGDQLEGQPRRQLPADRVHAAPHALAAAQGRADGQRPRDHVRVELRPAQHLHGRPPASGQRSAAVVVRLLSRGSTTATRSSSRRSAFETKAGWM